MNICCYAGVTATSPQVVAATPLPTMAWRSEWRSIEPKPPLNDQHTYKWTNLDAAIDAAHSAGKQSTIRVMGGDFTPTWVQPKVTYLNQSGNQKTQPIMWDKSYLDPYCIFIADLCTRYGSDPRVSWIVMSGCGLNDEMVIGWSTPTNVWQSSLPPPNGCGTSTYTPQRFVSAWNRCIDTYRNFLPRTKPSALCFDLVGEKKPPRNPMFVGTEAESIISHARTYGRKVYIQNNGLTSTQNTSGSGKTYDSKTYNIIYDASSTTTVGWQMQHDNHTPDDMRASLDIAVQSNASYVEVWPQDAINPLLAPIFASYL